MWPKQSHMCDTDKAFTAAYLQAHLVSKSLFNWNGIIQVCNSQSESFLSPSSLRPLVGVYNLGKKAVDIKAKLVKQALGQKENLQHLYVMCFYS